ncbi:TetR/AcrR family transcriptional regulator (plasmid) [Embleya sp. NBC_00888]|uniref:TetR/AcrR family transcriptional regulator n=1 Tax=Embleya sp. NBC_00888 TaxID=2975960 RepID=UPI002F919EFA|nr:TetR/AcrR family transcriptional regulator [Embleya sp. NBC_00888]
MTEQSARSIWLRPERAARGPAPEYDRDRIASAGVALADAEGLAAVTMRAVALALGAGPASLYRYVATRDELLELMTDRVNGEISYAGLGGGHWLDDLLALARESRRVHLAHPWLSEAGASRTSMGPHAVDYLDHAMAALADLPVGPRVKLEAVGILNAVVAALTRAEIEQRLAGKTMAQWQRAQAEYLAHVVGAGRHPHLSAVLTGTPPGADEEPAEPLFERLVTRVLIGLLHPEDTGRAGTSTRASGRG